MTKPDPLSPDYLQARCHWCDHAGVIRDDLRLIGENGTECVDTEACDRRAFAQEDADASAREESR